jgi:hypothetical protein
MHKTWSLCPVITAFAVAGCVAIPSRFTLLSAHSPHVPVCAYSVESENDDGFVLETITKKDAWNPDPALREARSCYARAATHIASGRNRQIVSPTVADMASNVTQGSDGWVVYVTGRIHYDGE